MSIEANHLLGAIAVGIGATLVMDLWNVFLKRIFRIPSLNYCLLGRWVRHLSAGTLRHPNITAAPPKPHECAVGWMAHYSIGIVLALGLVVLTSGEWLARPTVLPALLYGIATVVFPLFILQPSFGLGIAASRTPHPMQARLKSLVTHSVFGVGLYLCALGVSYTPVTLRTPMWRTDSLWFEAAIVLGIFAVGNILFGHFEQHKPPLMRLAKVALVLSITLGLSATVGRIWGLGWLLLPLSAAAYVHLRWLPRHGVNGWTGEPRDRYLALLGERRRRRSAAS
jgi:Protein of unknown function (DUF2938)